MLVLVLVQYFPEYFSCFEFEVQLICIHNAVLVSRFASQGLNQTGFNLSSY